MDERDVVDEWGEESFPASDAATGWQGPEEVTPERIEQRVGDHVAFLTYRLDAGRLVILHTEVPDELAHHGIGGELVGRAIELARRGDLTVVPRCPFARHWLSEHADARRDVRIEWARRSRGGAGSEGG